MKPTNEDLFYTSQIFMNQLIIEGQPLKQKFLLNKIKSELEQLTVDEKNKLQAQELLNAIDLTLKLDMNKKMDKTAPISAEPYIKNIKALFEQLVSKSPTVIPSYPELKTVVDRFNEIEKAEGRKGCQITDKGIIVYDERTFDALMNYVVKNGIDMHAVDSEGKIKAWSNGDGVLHTIPEGERLTPEEFLSKHEEQLSAELQAHISQAHITGENNEGLTRMTP